MKTLKFAAVAAVATVAAVVMSLSAFAQGATYEYPQYMTCNLTRVEVRTDLDAAQAMGTLASGETTVVAESHSRPQRATIAQASPARVVG